MRRVAALSRLGLAARLEFPNAPVGAEAGANLVEPAAWRRERGNFCPSVRQIRISSANRRGSRARAQDLAGQEPVDFWSQVGHDQPGATSAARRARVSPLLPCLDGCSSAQPPRGLDGLRLRPSVASARAEESRRAEMLEAAPGSPQRPVCSALERRACAGQTWTLRRRHSTFFLLTIKIAQHVSSNMLLDACHASGSDTTHITIPRYAHCADTRSTIQHCRAATHCRQLY